ncbi:MAG: galactose mutarotase [Synergistaceae bacterium]|jgi:aldose 1-epimerase|nr:galactose mutarotase [Synergistaceae bacterium]
MKPKHFGVTEDGQDVDLFELQNRNGVIVRCINYGCCITNILLPSASGHADIVLGFDDVAGYESDNSSQGAFIGRYANRIKGAEMTIGGRDFKLTQNDGANYLHGSLSKRVFAAEADDDGTVIFKTVSDDGEDGFPGNLRITVKYRLDDDDKFTMEYFALTDTDTYVNFTNHAYFDLTEGIDETIEDHILQIESDSFLEATDDLIPTGRILPVDGTPLDFRRQKTIGRDISSDDKHIKAGRGYDHTFILNPPKTEAPVLAAEACAPNGERSIRVFTTQPAVHLYTGNFLDGTLKGKGRIFTHRSAFCLETGHYPDSPHNPEFPTTLLRPGEEFHETTVLQFGF